ASSNVVDADRKLAAVPGDDEEIGLAPMDRVNENRTVLARQDVLGPIEHAGIGIAASVSKILAREVQPRAELGECDSRVTEALAQLRRTRAVPHRCEHPSIDLDD